MDSVYVLAEPGREYMNGNMNLVVGVSSVLESSTVFNFYCNFLRHESLFSVYVFVPTSVQSFI